MSNSPQSALTLAVLRIMRPLVRILLRNGIGFNAFADLAKAVYVEVAAREFAIPGRKQSVSRIAVITGLTRKEVSRLQESGPPEEGVAEVRYNRAARVVAGWVRDGRFTRDGVPQPLPFDGAGHSFSALVKEFSGDVPPRAILDELVRVGVVERLESGVIRLLTRAYVPQTGEEDKLHILGTDVAFLVGTIDHNLTEAADPWFQRKVAYDHLPDEAVVEFRRLSRAKAQELIEEMDGWLSQRDRDINPAVEGSGRNHAGLGIYYFEGDAPEES